MKNKYLVILFVVGIIYTSIGALFKILHFEIGFITGNILITIGVSLKVITSLIFIAKLLSDKSNNFLNK